MVQKADSYVVNNGKRNGTKDDGIWTISKGEREIKPFPYDEAVDLTGHGVYSMGLLGASSFCILGAILDLFSFPAITSVAACDLKLTSREEKILLSLPILGAMTMAYPWGYISDTKGRRTALLISMWGSFTASCLAAFSTHWIMLGILKFISVSLSTSYSCTYTMIGECCGTKVKAVYFFILTSMIHIAFPIQMALHYFSLTLDFSFDIGLLNFLPWRLLALALALPLGFSAICFHFLYESPKFLVNAGQEGKAVDILQKIWKKNGGCGLKYPVTELVLNENGNSRPSNVSLLQSLWNQIVPLFKKPLLMKTLQLYFLTMVIYSGCGGLLSWFPFLADAFISGTLTNHNNTEGLCNMITHYHTLKHVDQNSVSCVPKSNLTVVWASLAQGLSLSIINCSISIVANRRKVIMIIILFVSGFAALGCALLPNNVTSLSSYFAIFLSVVGTGIVFSYCVDLYPTSHRGMVSCLSMIVARGSNLMAITIVGHLVMEHCDVTFSIISATMFSGAVVACFLPSDKQKKSN